MCFTGISVYYIMAILHISAISMWCVRNLLDVKDGVMWPCCLFQHVDPLQSGAGKMIVLGTTMPLITQGDSVSCSPQKGVTFLFDFLSSLLKCNELLCWQCESKGHTHLWLQHYFVWNARLIDRYFQGPAFTWQRLILLFSHEEKYEVLKGEKGTLSNLQLKIFCIRIWHLYFLRKNITLSRYLFAIYFTHVHNQGWGCSVLNTRQFGNANSVQVA